MTILVFGTNFAQENKQSDCKLELENELWIKEFIKAESKSKKIELIKNKIKADSVYAKYEPKIRTKHSATITNEQVNENGTKCGCKIYFALQYKNRDAIELNLNSKPELSNLIKILNSENIEEIINVFDKTALMIYGSYGECGYVKLKTRNRKLKRKIKSSR